MPISSRALADDEEVLVDLRLHWVFFLGPAVLTAVALAAAITVTVRFPNAPVAVAGVLAAMVAVPALWLIGRIVRWFGISLIVTSARIVYRQGILGSEVVELRLRRVSGVQCTQTLLDRVLGTGRLVVGIVGEEPTVFEDVRKPRALQRVITRQLDALVTGIPAAAPIHGSGVPTSPISVPRPVSVEDTPPHGFIPSPSPALLEPPVPTGETLPLTGTAGASIPEQLIELDDLRRRGILTDSEFAAKKAELLSRI